MPTSSPPIIGLVGGIGAGKSAVAGILRDLGCVVSDSDAAGRAALRDPDIRREVVSWWGDDVLDDDGAIDRSKVAAIVFADAEQRRRLEGLTHPWIEQRRRELFAGAPSGTRAFVIDAPLLMEAGLDAMCDAVLFVAAERVTRLDRVRTGRGWDDSMHRSREESQIPLDEKRNRADHVVTNDGALSDLRERVHTILNQIAPPAGP